VGEAGAAREAALADTQDVADVLLEAERRLGEVLAAIEPKYDMPSTTGRHVPNRAKTLPEGISWKQSHEAQVLARNPEVIERVKDKARGADTTHIGRCCLLRVISK